MSKDELTVSLNWTMEEEEFIARVDMIIKMAKDNKKIIPLPVPIKAGIYFAGQVATLLASVNCRNCSSVCCREETSADQGERGIGLFLPDIQRINAKGYSNYGKPDNKGRIVIDYPCPFWKEETPPGEHCIIYKDRPTPCMMFPFQPGGSTDGNHTATLAVASECPEGPRIAREIYITTYRIANRFTLISSELKRMR